MNNLTCIKHWMLFGLMACLITTSCDDIDNFTKVNATFYFINQTDSIVTMANRCGFEELGESESKIIIHPNDTLILTHKEIETFVEEPSQDRYSPISRQCTLIYGDSTACQFDRRVGFGDIKNYVNRKEVSKNNFEFTYLITEQTKAEAGECL